MEMYGIYVHLESSQKQHTWTLLKMLANLSSHPWCCFGDFNEIIHIHDKHGGSNPNLNIVADFREVVQTFNLVDIGYKGSLFTWSKKRYGLYFIEERLDKFLCSKN